MGVEAHGASLRTMLATVIGFAVTPFTDALGLDLGALRTVVGRMVGGGVRTIVCAGGTGELYALSPAECTAVYETTVDAAGSRTAVIAAVGFGTEVAKALVQEADRVGAAAILIMPPYLRQIGQEGLRRYYREVAGSTTLPCICYARDGIQLDTVQLERLCLEAPNLVAFKDGTGDIRRFQDYRRALGSRLIWLCGAGDDLAPAYFAAGADGFTSSVANFDPGLPRRLLELCRSGDLAAAGRFVDSFIRPFFSLRLAGYDVSLIKAACELAGVRTGPVRPPAPELSSEHRRRLQNDLLAAGLIADEASQPHSEKRRQQARSARVTS